MSEQGIIETPPAQADPAPVAAPAESPAPIKIEPRFAWLQWRRRSKYSQFGEAGIIIAIAERIGCPEFGWVVDVGAHDGIKFSNSRELIERNWLGVLFEPKPERYARLLENCRQKLALSVQETVTPMGPKGLDSLLPGYEVIGHKIPEDFDVLLIDIDSYDWHVWYAMNAYRPKIVVIEHADKLSVDLHTLQPMVPKFEDCGKKIGRPDFYVQANQAAIVALARNKGYTLVADNRCNSIFVRNDLVDLCAEENHGLGEGVRLNIGAGTTILPGYIPLDADLGHDITKLDYPDASVDAIYASHVLEHVSFKKRMDVLREWTRVLKPGGVLQVCVPDYKKMIDLGDRLPWHEFEQYIMGSHTDDYDYHKGVFTEQMLTSILMSLGYDCVGSFEPFLCDCSNAPISTNLQGIKRKMARPEKPVIFCVASKPRLTFTDQEDSLHNLMMFDSHRKGGPLIQGYASFGSVYWEKALTAAIVEAMSRGADYVFITDYDSFYKPSDFEVLVKAMEDNPDVAVVFGQQVSRHNDRPLLHKEKHDYTGETTETAFGHFGFTLIRREVFCTLPEPWFMSLPDPRTGEWGNKAICSDADVTFWRLLGNYGFKALQLNAIPVGHGVLSVKWNDKERANGVIMQPIEHWRRQGRPPRAGWTPPALVKSDEKPEPQE